MSFVTLKKYNGGNSQPTKNTNTTKSNSADGRKSSRLGIKNGEGKKINKRRTR